MFEDEERGIAESAGVESFLDDGGIVLIMLERDLGRVAEELDRVTVTQLWITNSLFG